MKKRNANMMERDANMMSGDSNMMQWYVKIIKSEPQNLLDVGFFIMDWWKLIMDV